MAQLFDRIEEVPGVCEEGHQGTGRNPTAQEVEAADCERQTPREAGQGQRHGQ